MSYFAYNVGGWVEKEGKMCLHNKSMAPKINPKIFIFCLICIISCVSWSMQVLLFGLNGQKCQKNHFRKYSFDKIFRQEVIYVLKMAIFNHHFPYEAVQGHDTDQYPHICQKLYFQEKIVPYIGLHRLTAFWPFFKLPRSEF